MMDPAVRILVQERAKQRCEYCHLSQDDADFFLFHVEHVIPKQHGGSNDAENLCLACAECNWAKGPNLVGLLEGKVVRLFDPRRQSWSRHFRWHGPVLIGKTRCGKVTVHVLNINAPARVEHRENLLREGRTTPER